MLLVSSSSFSSLFLSVLLTRPSSCVFGSVSPSSFSVSARQELRGFNPMRESTRTRLSSELGAVGTMRKNHLELVSPKRRRKLQMGMEYEWEEEETETPWWRATETPWWRTEEPEDEREDEPEVLDVPDDPEVPVETEEPSESSAAWEDSESPVSLSPTYSLTATPTYAPVSTYAPTPMIPAVPTVSVGSPTTVTETRPTETAEEAEAELGTGLETGAGTIFDSPFESNVTPPVIEQEGTYLLDLAPFSISVEGTVLQDDLGMAAYMDYQLKAAMDSRLLEVTVTMVRSAVTFSPDSDTISTASYGRNVPGHNRHLAAETIEFVGTARFRQAEEPLQPNEPPQVTEGQLQFLQVHILQDTTALTAYFNANAFLGSFQLQSIDFYGAEINIINDNIGQFNPSANVENLNSDDSDQTLWIIIFSVGTVFICFILVGIIYLAIMRARASTIPYENWHEGKNDFNDTTMISTPDKGRFTGNDFGSESEIAPPRILDFESDADISELENYSLTHQCIHRYYSKNETYDREERDQEQRELQHELHREFTQEQSDIEVIEIGVKHELNNEESVMTNSKTEEWSYKQDQKSTGESEFTIEDYSTLGNSQLLIPIPGTLNVTGSATNHATQSLSSRPSSAGTNEVGEAKLPSRDGSKDKNLLDEDSETDFTFRNVATKYSFDNSISLLSTNVDDVHAVSLLVGNAVSSSDGKNASPSVAKPSSPSAMIVSQEISSPAVSSPGNGEWLTEEHLMDSNIVQSITESKAKLPAGKIEDQQDLVAPRLDDNDDPYDNVCSLPKWRRPLSLSRASKSNPPDGDTDSTPSDELVDEFDHDLENFDEEQPKKPHLRID